MLLLLSGLFPVQMSKSKLNPMGKRAETSHLEERVLQRDKDGNVALSIYEDNHVELF